MNAGLALSFVLVVSASGTAAWAQPADLPISPATTTVYPPGVRVGTAGGTRVYVAQDGRTLYGLDLRAVVRSGPDPLRYCIDACTEEWEPLLAPIGAEPVMKMGPTGATAAAQRGQAQEGSQPRPASADWGVVHGPDGPQWIYKGWHLVYLRKGEPAGSAAHEGEQDFAWNTLKFIPPTPALTAPGEVTALFRNGAYLLADGKGRLLYTGTCTADCTAWQSFTGGMASRGTGDWTVRADADTPQWLFRGKPVFVAEGSATEDLPRGATALRP